MTGDVIPAFVSLLAPTVTFLIAATVPSDPRARRVAGVCLGLGLVSFLWLAWPLTRYVSGSEYLYNGFSFGEQLILALVSLLDLCAAWTMYVVTQPRTPSAPRAGRTGASGRASGAGRRGKRHGSRRAATARPFRETRAPRRRAASTHGRHRARKDTPPPARHAASGGGKHAS